MRILWFPRLQFDVDHLHMATWREMALALERQGHCVRVAVAGISKRAAPPGWVRLPLVPIPGLRVLGFWLCGYAAFLWQWLTFRPDLVILDVHTAGFGFPMACLSRRATWLLDQRTPIAHTSLRRGPFRQAWEQALTATALACARKWFDGLTTITEAFRDRMAQRYGVPRERIGVWGSGIDPERFDPARCTPTARAESLRGRFVVFQHGEISFNRGILETVRALREPGMEDVALVLRGEGPAQAEILRLARECRVEDRVQILPPVPQAEIPAQILQCDCAVLAYPVDEYWNCNHPLKFVEALAMGKVVICTPMEAVRAAGPSARFLEIIPDNRPESIAAGIRNCKAAPDLRERGQAGIAFVRAHATWAAQAERLMAFVRQRQAEGRGA